MLRFAPDADPATPEILTAVDGFIPSIRGYEAMPSGQTAGIAALAAACTGAALVINLNGTAAFYAGTDTKLYKAGSTTWADVSRGGNYASGSKWRFAQFGNVTLAVNRLDTMQFATTGSFADIASGIKAKYVTTAAANFVLAANTNDGTYGDCPNRWWCSGIGDYSDWTPAVATQCTTGLLVDTHGGITGFGKIGDWILIFKERALYVGQYVGTPTVWDWTLNSNTVGAPCQEAIVNTDAGVLFLGPDDFYLFNGSAPVRIGNEIRDWFFADRSSAYRDTMASAYNFNDQRVFWFYVSAGGTTIDSWMCYDLRTQRWGAGTLGVEAVADFQQGIITYVNIGDYFASYAATIPAYGSVFWNAGTILPAYIGTDHIAYTFDGTPGAASMTTGDMGDDEQFTRLTRILPRWVDEPTSATLTNYFKNRLGDALTTDAVTTMDSRARFDVLRSARYHRVKLETSGACEVTALRPALIPEGFE